MYGYRNVLKRYVIPNLGLTRLVRLQLIEIERLYASLQQQGLSPRTVTQLHRILKKALKQAVRWNLIGRSPAEMVDPPAFQRREMPALNVDQLLTLLESVAAPPFGVPIYVAAYTGMRRGELVGLKWSDIDFENQVISIRREIVFVPGKGYLVTPPKSAKGQRAIDITSDVVSALQRYRSVQAQQQLLAGPVWNDGGWVFTRADGNHVNPNAVSKAFMAIRTELGLPPVRLHDLRHTHASLLLQAGTHLKVVQERLGHSTIAITADTYSHVSPGLQKAAAKAFEALVTRSGAVAANV